MYQEVENLAKEFLKESKSKKVKIITSQSTDGLTSAAILAKTLKNLDISFVLQTINKISKEEITKAINNSKEIILFNYLKESDFEIIQKDFSSKIFVINYDYANFEKISDKIKTINKEELSEEIPTSASLCYLFSKAISEKNKSLSKLAIISFLSRKFQNQKTFFSSKIYQEIINDCESLDIKKGLIINPATRPLKRVLETSASYYIPQVTGNSMGVLKLLKEVGIDPEKSIIELEEEETSKLITSIILRQFIKKTPSNILGEIYLSKHYGSTEDLREVAFIIKACAISGLPDLAINFLLENEKIKSKTLEVYSKYKQELILGIKTTEKIEKINGNGFVIFNAKDQIKEAFVKTVCSVLSNSKTYSEGTILVGMAYNKDKIKVSARIVGESSRNTKEILEKTIDLIKKEEGQISKFVMGNSFEADCLIEREKELEFLENLKKNLEIEVIKF